MKKPSNHGNACKALSILRTTLLFLAVVFCGERALGQTVTLTPTPPLTIWAGANVVATNIFNTSFAVRETGGGATTNIVLSIFGTNAVTIQGRFNSTNMFTNNATATLVLSLTNVAKGIYPITAEATGDALFDTNVYLFVVPQWAQTNGGSIGVWSDPTKWSTGVSPVSSDSVFIEHTFNGISFTNVVDSSQSIQALIYIGDGDDNSGVIGVNTVISNGLTLSVVGTNGFFIGTRANNNTRPTYLFSGGGNLVVSNPVANFVVANGTISSGTRPVLVNMTNLNSLSATVSRFGPGDATLDTFGLQGGVMVNFFLARTNTITALYADDYSALQFQNSFQYMANGDAASGGLNPTFNLGVTNGFFMDSLGVGRSRAQGTAGVGLNGGGSTLRFAPAFANSVTPIASAYFRNTNGGRMSLVAVGVDSGTNSSGNNTKGSIDLRGGITDMLVDEIWIGRNRTNVTSVNAQELGAFIFDWGTVNANIVRAGDYHFTNVALVQGYISVGTNGVLTVNKYIELTHRPTDVTGFEAILATAVGQMQIVNGGIVRANAIICGTNTANNQILINTGGGLVLTNTAGDATNKLAVLNVNRSSITFHIDGSQNITNIQTKSIVFAGSPNVINISTIANLTSIPQRFTLIAYDTAATAPAFTKGSMPVGFNGTVNNTGTGTGIVYIDITTNTPKTLVWRGYLNGNWDHSTTNWWDPVALTFTNTFNDGDFVIFDDSAVGTTTISVTENISPGQAVDTSGVVVSNNAVNYSFNNGGGVVGLSSLVKTGAGSLAVNCHTELSVRVDQGIVTGSGDVGAVSVIAGAALGFAGNINGAVSCSGIATNSGTITGSLSVGNGGSVYNIGTANGTLSVGDNAFLYNQGNMTSIGAAAPVGTNSTFLNAGNLTGGGLSISGTYRDTGAGALVFSNVTTINGNGLFFPGNVDGSSPVTVNFGSFTTAARARVLLANGSTNIFGVNADNGNANRVISRSIDFGNNNTLSGGGGVILITNRGVNPLAAGQTYRLFENDLDDTVPLFEAGTNTAPIILPPAPGPGLAWDSSTLRKDGRIKILSVSTNPVTFGMVTSITNDLVLFNGTNNLGTNLYTTNKAVIIQLNWPSTNLGWRLQQQISSVNSGIRAGDSNWTYVYPSWWTNSISVTNNFGNGSAVFFRMVYP